MAEEGFVDLENDEVSKRLETTFTLTIVEQLSGRETQLKLSGRTTMQELKTNVFYVTNIPVGDQAWAGWPHGCENITTLSQSGIELSHSFIVQNAMENAIQTIDIDSSGDEHEDELFTDFPPVVPPIRHLIANNNDNETSGSIQFVDNYKERYGEPVPNFFIGSLEDARKLACHRPAKERKLLAVYLHHDESILSNIFCYLLLKNESIIQTFDQHFVLYGWDLTFESNKHLFLASITGCVGDKASETVQKIELCNLPSILIIGKSRLLGRNSCELLTVIHGDVSVDNLLSRLIEVVEMHAVNLQDEIREEDERAARNQKRAVARAKAKERAQKKKEAATQAKRPRLDSE